MKKQKRKISLIVIAILILCIFLFQNKKKENNQFQDELIFFKLFSSGQDMPKNKFKSENQTYQRYIFHVSYKNTDFKNIYLSDTIDYNTLIREKIAPRHKRCV